MFKKGKTYNLKSGCVTTLSTQDILKSTSINDLNFENRKETARTCNRNLKPFLGAFYTALCSITITLTSVFVKKLTYINSGELSLIRNVGVFVFNIPIALYVVKDILGRKKDRPLLIIRGFLGSTALYLNLLAFRYLPLAEAATIMSTTPATVSISARLYLKEPCGYVQSCALVITAIGVLISVRIPELLKNRSEVEFSSVYITGLGCAIGCVLILSFTFVTLRKMKDVHYSVIMIYFGWTGVLVNGTLTGVFGSYDLPRCGWDPVQMCLIGVLGFIGHVSLTLAIQAEAAGIVSIMKASLDIIVAMVFQVIFFGLAPDMYNIFGAGLVLTSVSILGLRKWISTLPEDAELHEKLRYLLL
ncbi:solute carrier family 35 member G1-like [Uloborus diversus]|uniref:solute carrier family 35 member G1-like n=1 Tax=Uloborus diversus TaxID=327109 RepID=UPI00240A3B4C|nr:solute carrier family 35 member G1-like [Uloborus diversus]